MPATATLERPQLGLPADWRRSLIDVLNPVVGRAPILLLGSRAVGSADATSDCDVAVVLPLHRVVRLAGRLQRLGEELSSLLGVPVSVNPIPRGRLSRSRGSLYFLKVREEAQVLAGWDRVVLRRRDTTVSPFAAASYVLCAILAVLEATDGPSDVGQDHSPQLAHAIRKAVLHVAQLRLLDDGAYASTLDVALSMVRDDELRAIAETADRATALDAVRELLLRESVTRPLVVPDWKATLRNVQYAALAGLRAHRRRRAIWTGSAVEVAIAQKLVSLLSELRRPESRGGTQLALSSVTGEDPDVAWRTQRDETCLAWRDAHPLAGVLG